MKFLFRIVVILILSTKAYGHGEDKPGPHGGFIKMPGAFHTEVVFDEKDGSVHLFLLDIEFKNPTVSNSSAAVTHEQKNGKRTEFFCEVMGGNHFHCKPKKSYGKDSGRLLLDVKREGAAGKTTYELPLIRKGGTPSKPAADHSHNH